LLYFKHGVTGKYEGARTREAIADFMRKMSTPVVSEISTLSALDSFYEIHPIAFCLTLPESDYVESAGWKQQFETAAKKQHLHATFVTFTTNEVAQPTLTKHESGRDTVTFSKKASSPITATEIENFVNTHNVPFISHFDSHNFKKLGSLGKMLAMVVVDNSKEQQTSALIKALDSTASALELAHKEKFVFGYIDGARWIKFLRQYGVEAVPSVLLLDLTLDSHLTIPLPSDSLTSENDYASAVSEVFTQYLDGRLQLKEMETPGILGKALLKVRRYYPWSLLCILPVLFLVLSLFLPYPEDQKEKKA
jgi:hypothetical protein